MARGKAAARRAPAPVSVPALDPDYDAFPDTAKGRAMARQAARRERDEKSAKKDRTGDEPPFVVEEPAEVE